MYTLKFLGSEFYKLRIGGSVFGNRLSAPIGSRDK